MPDLGQTKSSPTPVSYEIDGGLFDHLKYKITNHVDVDRQGPRARASSFALKEMVERFLYGLDENNCSNITQFCKQTIPKYIEKLINKLDFPDLRKKKNLKKLLGMQKMALSRT